MSLSVSPAGASSSASGAAAETEAPAQDGWRNGGLTALRAELDRIDNAIHDLLMQRAEVVEQVGRSGKPAAFRPGREASIIRRLLDRHAGALPPATLVRIWREMLAGTTAMQGSFALAVADATAAAPTELAVSQVAREHFGALTPTQVYATPDEALAAVSQKRVPVAVLPAPAPSQTWWVSLVGHAPRLYIIARLPFWAPRPVGWSGVPAVVVASTPADASAQDRSLLALECAGDTGDARLLDELSSAGLHADRPIRWQPAGSPLAKVLVEVDGYLADDDARLGRLASVLGPPVVLGSYAVPVGSDAP